MSKNLIALQNKFLGQGQTVYDELSKLHEKQGYISDDDIVRVAKDHNLPPQHVRSTAKFYEELSHDKPASHTIKLCNGEACRCAGFDQVKTSLCATLGVDDLHQISNAGVRLEPVTCLGLCGLGPNAMVDGQVVSLKKPGSVEKVAASVRMGDPLDLEEPINTLHLPAEGKPRIVTRNFERDVLSLQNAYEAGIYTTLQRVLEESGDVSSAGVSIVGEVKASGLRGRGGAGFPSGIKFETVRNAESPDGRKFVCVNADEGDAGSYIDKEIMERDPHSLIEGTLLAALACGAQDAYFYIRFEYPRSLEVMRKAIDEAYEAGFAGKDILGTGFNCDLKIVKGQGAYICGEETSLLRSIEGVPAIVSFKPPFPAEKGLWGCPTAVNNVETLHNLPWIVEQGGEAYSQLGFERSKGTKGISINSRVKRPGMYEVELGTTLRELIFDHAGGMADGEVFQAVQVGGPLGGIFPEELLDTPLDFEAMGKVKGLLGHGGVVVYSEKDDLLEIGRWLMEFCAIESCGKCFPCRIGAVRGTELFDQMLTNGVTDQKLELLSELCETMKYGSLCALGGAIPTPVECLMEYFPHLFEAHRKGEVASV